MKTPRTLRINRCAAALAALFLATGASAGQHALLAPASGDLAVTSIVAPSASQATLPPVSHDAVAISWAAQGPVAQAAKPYLAQSRQYSITVSGAELAAGVPIHTTAPRAVVRLQPLAVTGPRENAAIHPLSLVIHDAAGHAHADGSGMEMLVTSDKLAKADVPAAPGTSAFRIHPDLGSGSMRLQASGLADGDRYLIHVVEPDSKLTLTMQAGAGSYLHGQQLSVQSALLEADDKGGSSARAMSHFDGVVVSPGGRSFPVSFKGGKDGRLLAQLPLDADESPAPGMWEVQGNGTATVKGQTVMRSLRLAFAVAMPVARLENTVETVGDAPGLKLRLGVDAAIAGRYEVRALLYGTVDGSLKPLGVAHAAQWLEAGSGHIALGFAPELVGAAQAPFELRELCLLDQGRMGLLHQQQRALLIDEADVVRAGARAGVAAQPASKVKRMPTTGEAPGAPLAAVN